jgi:polysaccharide biosynthesis transport protein
LTTTFVLTAILLAVSLGLVIATLLERLDKNLHSASEIETATKLHFLAAIPEWNLEIPYFPSLLHVAQNQPALSEGSELPFTESLRSLSEALQRLTPPPKIIQIVSAAPAAGKTTIASNLACSLAASGFRVLLIDADLRRPNIHRCFALRNEIGLTTVLDGILPLEEVLQRSPGVLSLEILTVGQVPPFPTILLGSERIGALLKKCVDLYDYIILDSSPVLPADDGAILSTQTDAVVLVVGPGDSLSSVVRARDLLLRSGAPLAGFVLNAVATNTSEEHPR